MEKIKNLKINWKKIVSALLTSTIITTLSGCCLDNHEEIIEEKNNTISSLEQEKTNLEQENLKLQEQLNELTQPYDEINFKTISRSGDLFIYVRKKAQNGKVLEGIYNSTQNKMEIPCEYDHISLETQSKTGFTYVDICQSKNGKMLYGIYNVTLNRIDLPCEYDYIGEELTSETGHIFRRIYHYTEDGYLIGIYDVINNRIYEPEYEEIKENGLDENYDFMGKKQNGEWENIRPAEKTLTKTK